MFNKLSPREREIARLVAIERRAKKPPASSASAFAPLRPHRTHIYDKLGVRTIGELAGHLAGEQLVAQ
jgi:DNA-binding CsgD family transcriptional regulator